MALKRPCSDSPAFWFAVFATMAIAGLCAIGPKYQRRRAAMDLQYQAREQVWRKQLSQTESSPVNSGPETPSAYPGIASSVTNRGTSMWLPVTGGLGLLLLALILSAAAVASFRRRQPNSSSPAGVP